MITRAMVDRVVHVSKEAAKRFAKRHPLPDRALQTAYERGLQDGMLAQAGLFQAMIQWAQPHLLVVFGDGDSLEKMFPSLGEAEQYAIGLAREICQYREICQHPEDINDINDAHDLRNEYNFEFTIIDINEMVDAMAQQEVYYE